MNEDDTFRILARRPYSEVRENIRNISTFPDSRKWVSCFLDILRESKWTEDEWHSETIRQTNRLP